MMPQEELLGVLAQKMPEYSKEEDCRTLVRNFYEKYVDQNRPMNLKQKEVFLRSLKAEGNSTDEPTPLRNMPTITVNINQLPMGLKESLKPYPQNMWPALIVGQMPALMALADGVSYRYCNGKIGYLAGMAIIFGEQASNKSAIEEAVERWLVDLRKEDEAVREREDKVREANKRRKANERAQEAPAGVVRVVPITISCSKLLKRLKQSQGHSLYSICTEAETLLKSNGSGAWAQKWDIYRNAFGRERWGVEYNSDQSESGDVNVAYSWTILGTPRTVLKMFKGKNESNAENGLSSRMMLSEMPDTMFAKITVFKELSESDMNRINEATALLRSATGFYDTPRLRKAIDRWLEEKRVESAMNMDVIKDRFRRRAAVIGFRCGVVFMLLAGKESNACVDFALKMAEYTLQMQLKVFGPLLYKYLHEDSNSDTGNSINSSIFEQLPSPFSFQDLRRLKGNEFSDGSLYSIISRWKSEGWVEKTGKSQWSKKR
jgi:DNA-binding PadR family transcriptional regulator